MTVSTLFGDTADGYIHETGNSASYTALRAGTGSMSLNAVGANAAACGQEWNNSVALFGYYEAFISFDLSPAAITAGATINSVTLSLFPTTVTIAGGTPQFQARSYDWGATLSTADFVASPTPGLSSLTLLATLAGASAAASSYNAFTESGSNFKSAVSAAGSGFLRILMCTDLMVAGTAPSTSGNNPQYMIFDTADNTGTTVDPKLVIDWSAPSGPTNLKTVNGLAKASVKTLNGLAMASVKTHNGIAMPTTEEILALGCAA